MSKIKKLINPKNDLYYRLKEYVLSSNFLWSYNESAVNEVDIDESDKDRGKYTNIPVYGHTVIGRPQSYDMNNPLTTIDRNDNLVSVVDDWVTYGDYVQPFLYDLLCANPNREECHVKSILRINFNATHTDVPGRVFPHLDHNRLPHKNMLVYLTDADGSTIVGDELHDPEEDDIIVFDSSVKHCHDAPKNKRRVVMVMTFI